MPASHSIRFFCCTLLLVLGIPTLTGEASAALRPARESRAELRRTKRETPLVPHSFAHSLTLDGQAGAVLSFVLPEMIYKGLQLYDFSDLCVFDVEGTPVPFLLRSPDGAHAVLEVSEPVPHFPWQPEKPGAQNPGSMDVEINARGAIVRIKGQADVPRPGPVSYLLDMQQFTEAKAGAVAQDASKFTLRDLTASTLKLGMAGDGAFMTTVTMKTSADLVSWESVGRPQVVARARQKDVVLERDTVILPNFFRRYILLQFSDSEAPVISFLAEALFGKKTHERRETILAGTLSENKRTVDYKLPGRFPLVAMGFDLPQADIMAVRLMGTDEPARPFRQYASGFVYRLEKDGVVVTGDPFSVTDSRSHWSLVAAGDIPFATAPGLRAYWQPKELLFLARGKGPWTLAYGRNVSVNASTLPMLDKGSVLPAKEIASSVIQPDADKASVAPASGGMSQWLLWAVLVLAVVFLSGITIWLLRGMRK